MGLLDNKGELEVGNVEGQVFRIEDAQHVNLLYDSLYTSLQLAHTLLLTGILFKEML